MKTRYDDEYKHVLENNSKKNKTRLILIILISKYSIKSHILISIN